MAAYLNCNIAPGQFSGEYAIRGSAQAGEFSLFAPKECVETGSGDTGLLRVKVLKKDGSRALVELPVQTFENGQAVTVNFDQITERD